MAAEKKTAKRVTVADVVARLDEIVEYQGLLGETLDTVSNRLNAQRDGLEGVESKLEDMAVKVWGQEYPDEPVMKFDSTPIRLQADMHEQGVPIEDLMDGGNVAATEALGEDGVNFDTMKSILARMFDVPEELLGFDPTTFDVEDENRDTFKAMVDDSIEFTTERVRDTLAHDSGKVTDHAPQWEFDPVLGRNYCTVCFPDNPVKPDSEPTSSDTEQAILRVASRLYYLQMAENIMDSQAGNQRTPTSTRSGWVGDAFTEEVDMLFPLLFTWVRERGWLP